MSEQSKLAYFIMQELMHSDEALEPGKLCVRVCLRDERNLSEDDEEITAAIQQLLAAGFIQQILGNGTALELELTEDGEDHFEWYQTPLNPQDAQSPALKPSNSNPATDASIFNRITVVCCVLISFLCAVGAIGLTIYTATSHVDVGPSVFLLALGSFLTLCFGEYIADA